MLLRNCSINLMYHSLDVKAVKQYSSGKVEFPKLTGRAGRI
jgi:hypothetical protein